MAAIVWTQGDTYLEDWKITRPSVQDVVIEGAPSGGTFVLSVLFPTGSEVTANIPHNATAGTVLTLLEELQSVDSGDVSVSGGPGPASKWVVTWNTTTAYPMTASGTFSGGSSATKVYVRQQAFDLTGATIRWTLKATVDQDDVDAAIQHRWTHSGTVSPAGAITVVTPSTGRVVHLITSTETGALEANVTYLYDTQLTDASSVTTTVDSGTFLVTPDVTNTVP